MKSLLVIMLVLLVTPLNLISQNKTRYYSDYNDTTFKSSSYYYVFSANLILRSDKAFFYTSKEEGYCGHGCQNFKRQGTWYQKDDSVFLLYTYSYELHNVVPLISFYDSLEKNVHITVRNERGDLLSGVKIITDNEWPLPERGYTTDSVGQVWLKNDSLSVIKLGDRDYVRLRFEYLAPDGEVRSRTAYYLMSANVISFKIYLTPVYTTEIQTLFYVESGNKLIQVQQHNTKDMIDYWGHMRLCESYLCIKK